MAMYYVTLINPKCIQQDNLSYTTFMPYNIPAICIRLYENCCAVPTVTFLLCDLASSGWTGEVYDMQVLLYTIVRFLLQSFWKHGGSWIVEFGLYN